MRRVLGGAVAIVLVLGILGAAGCGMFSPPTTTTSSTTTIITTTTTTEPPASWRQVAPSGESPSARCFQVLVYDPTSSRVIMFAGFDGTNALSETWAYDASSNTWTDLGPEGEKQPSAAEQLPGAFDPSTEKVISFDGTSWGYDVQANRWRPLSPKGDKIIPARVGTSMVFHQKSGKVILFGGTDRNTWYNETWSYDPSTNRWTKLELEGAVPSGRSDAGMAYDPTSGKIYLFGGIDEDYDCLNDTWSYDLETNTWAKLIPAGEVPSARSGMAMAYDPRSQTIIVFGGIDSALVCYDDTWALDPAQDEWTQLAPRAGSPLARGRMSLVYAEDIDKLVLFGGVTVQPDAEGGFGAQAYLGDLWVFGLHLEGSEGSLSESGDGPVTATTRQGAVPGTTTSTSR